MSVYLVRICLTHSGEWQTTMYIYLTVSCYVSMIKEKVEKVEEVKKNLLI